MNSRLHVPAALVLLLAAQSSGFAQTTPARPQFEVASLKLNTACNNRSGGEQPPTPGRLHLACITLKDLIQLAYGFLGDGKTFNRQRLDVLGLPKWADEDRYDLAAKAEGAARVEQMGGPMLQALLEDRFRLKLHRESREVSVYALTVGKNGPKLQPMKEGSCVEVDLNHLPPPPAPGQPMPRFCGNASWRSMGKTVTLDGHGMTMAEFAQSFAIRVDHPVIDKTAIAGKFDFHLEFGRDEMPGMRPQGTAADPANPANPAQASDPAGPSLFAAIQEQLGLKLVSEKGQTDFLVVDHVEKPTDN